MEILYLILGVVIGAILIYFITSNRFIKKHVGLESENKMLQSSEQFIKEKNEELNDQLEVKEKQILDLTSNLSTKSSDLKHLSEKLNEQKQDIEQLQDKFKIEFKNLANEILEEKSQKFTQQNKINMDEILKPLGEKIKDFEKKVEDTYDKGVKDQSDLKVELRRLHDLNLKLDEDAKNLTNALKSDVQKQGNWGEMVLEKILERSGLIKGQEYVLQDSTRNEEGELFKPDVVLYLPDNKHIIIDSKVSLLDYEEFVNSDDELIRTSSLKKHVDSIKKHIKLLSDKKYYTLEKFDTPDFVLMFLPIESAFSIAIQTDPNLYNLAWDNRIVIVTPTTLLATLSTVASIWKHEKQTKNALEIARQSGDLYDKFKGFIDDLIDVGNKLRMTQKSYEASMNKLTSGKGNLVSRVERIKKLGAKTSKSIPEKILERLDEDEQIT